MLQVLSIWQLPKFMNLGQLELMFLIDFLFLCIWLQPCHYFLSLKRLYWLIVGEYWRIVKVLMWLFFCDLLGCIGSFFIVGSMLLLNFIRGQAFRSQKRFRCGLNIWLIWLLFSQSMISLRLRSTSLLRTGESKDLLSIFFSSLLISLNSWMNFGIFFIEDVSNRC